MMMIYRCHPPQNFLFLAHRDETAIDIVDIMGQVYITPLRRASSVTGVVPGGISMFAPENQPAVNSKNRFCTLLTLTHIKKSRYFL